MTTATTTVQDEEKWRGVAAEDVEELDYATGAKLQARSRRLLGSLLRPHTRAAVLALALVVAENLVNLAGPLLIAAAIDRGVPAALDGRPTVLAWCVGGYVAVALAATLLRWAFIRLTGRIGQDLLLDLRERVFRHAQRLSVSFHERYTSGKVISRLTSDVDSLQDLLEQGLDGFFTSMLSVVGISIVMLTLDPPLAAVVLFGFLPLLVLVRWFRRRSAKAYRGTRGAIAKVIVQFVETMNGIRAVQAFRREKRNEHIMGEFNDKFRDANTEAFSVVAVFTSLVRVIGNVSLAVILAWGAWRVAQGDLELGVLAAFTLYVRRFYDPFDEIAMFATTYASATAALEKISGVLEERPAVPEPEDPAPLRDVRGQVAFDGVEFRYTPTTPVVLPEFDLHVPAGQTVALVGATGAGKSTLAKLVARFYDPSAGAVRLDGIDLRSVADADLRRAVVMVTQENFLFDGSVADNIALGRPSATREEVVSAARAVGAHEFISALPDGYDTDVRKRGGRLSAGQRQLVAFARAFLADPAVLVLDEATSSLDVPTERLVQHALETVLADRTAFIIAHRLSTVMIADRVLVLDAGRVVEDGTPDELIEGRGRFAALDTAWRESLA
ncbi:ABC transporter ATP-binding protein [Saccharothrix variisporea]|uniref:ABC-type multidrug transport system fused ATPase/permease subunit n=1 Tax=Saccharothrix variisporea TaxID=543527 RepID=A0A495XDV8_9PSEU|nr:ABC transporter ATP-binding protein [Saccharothrix variisporea]RKT71004.1 ABC-type multidrug transport system fused ATPase/permease subunit [Saccharothrix variisporea]